MFYIKSLYYVVLIIENIQESIKFYCEILGCRVERRVESIGLVQLRAGSSLIDLVPASSEKPAGRNMDHFALTISPFDEPALKAYFAHHGVAIGDVARRYGAEGYGPSIYLNDPDGNQVELKGPPEA